MTEREPTGDARVDGLEAFRYQTVISLTDISYPSSEFGHNLETVMPLTTDVC
jgi:hypothetical protein